MITRIAAMIVLAAVSLGAQDAPPPAPAEVKPAFANQTKAPAPARASRYTVETVASGLNHPWALQFLPSTSLGASLSGALLVTERVGTLRIVSRDGRVGEPIDGMPAIRVVAAEGLHDVVLDPQFATNRMIYFSYFAPPSGEAGGPFPNEQFQAWQQQTPEMRAMNPPGFERVASARLSEDGTRVENVTVILEGGNRRLVFGRDGTLFVTASTPAGVDIPIDNLPQDLGSFHGKVLRINPDGSVPRDNPYAAARGADAAGTSRRPDIWVLGLKDPEGAALHPTTGVLWTVEHGPMGGDEINIARRGANFGYPVITYGVQYSGETIGDGLTARIGLQQPVYFWVPSIGPSGMTFYTGDLFPQWRGDLFVGAMPGKHLVRLVLDRERVTAEEKLLTDLDQRIRDVRQGPDGALWILTDEDNGKILRIVPRS
jgi:glucose/arabinose dehydrogenase